MAMKQMLFAALLLLAAIGTNAQDTPAVKGFTYKDYTLLPVFQLRKPDSSMFRTTSVPEKNKQLVVVYFSPTCSHCQHQTQEITSNMKQLKDVKFLFVSSYSLEEIRGYVKEYAIDRFSNITIGQDPDFKMGRFYALTSMPGIFVYDKKGRLVKNFDTNVTIKTLLSALGKDTKE